MHILVLNSGSSSIKFSVFEMGADARVLLGGEASGLETDGAALRVNVGGASAPVLRPGDGAGAASAAIAGLVSDAGAVKVDAIGYRVVHPGPKLSEHKRLTPEVMRELEAAVEFAPLHQPAALELMREMGKHLPGVARVLLLRHGVSPDDAGGGPRRMRCRRRCGPGGCGGTAFMGSRARAWWTGCGGSCRGG